MNKKYWQDLAQEYKLLLTKLEAAVMDGQEYDDLESYGDKGYLVMEIEEERSNMVNAIQNFLDFMEEEGVD